MKTTFLYLVLSILFLIAPAGHAQAQSTITGHVLGADGNPMPMAHVFVCGGTGHDDTDPGLHDKDIMRVQVASDGSFSLSIDSLGAFYLVFTGVGHERMQVPLALEHFTNLDVRAQLERYNLFSGRQFLLLRYDFDLEPLGKMAQMKLAAPGIFEAEVSTSRKEFKYRLSGMGGSPYGVSMPGATADSYEYALEGTYTTVVHPVNGKVKIVFRDTIQRSDSMPVKISFSDQQNAAAKFVLIHRRFEESKKEYDDAMKKHLLEGKSLRLFSYDWSKTVEQIKSELISEREPLIRQELLMQYFELARLSFKNFDSSFVRRNIRDVPPTSLAWVYHGSMALEAGSFLPEGDPYVQQLLEQHPTRSYRALMLFRLCTYARMQKKQNVYARYFYQLTNDYSDTPAGQSAARVLRPNGSLQVGMAVPRFEFESVDDSRVKYSNSDFKGKYVLIDFWATWCTPCREELQFLQRAYDTFHDKTFEILSVSFDESVDHVKYFHSTKSKMPWLNAYVPKNRQAAVSLAFEVVFPKPILISPSGTILEIDESLRGEQLEKTLTKYLGKGN